jgi:hypothetical protein
MKTNRGIVAAAIWFWRPRRNELLNQITTLTDYDFLIAPARGEEASRGVGELLFGKD